MSVPIRPYALLKAVECGKCGHKASILIGRSVKTQIVGHCEKCNAYVKNIAKNERVALRAKDEDRKGPNRSFYIICAIKDGECKPAKSVWTKPEADAAVDRLLNLNKGYKVTCDFIPASDYFVNGGSE